MRLKELFELRNGYTPSKNVPEFWEGGTIPWFRMEDIRKNGRILGDSIQHITAEAVKTAGLFDANSFIVATTATIGEHAWLIADSLANQRFTNLKVRKSLEVVVKLKYIFFLLFYVGEECKKYTRTTTFSAVNMNDFKNIELNVPPVEEQEAIAGYLDRECGKIGREVELLERKVDAYRRLRRSIINQAVTRGLNPSAPLMPSGIPFLGDVPEHWAIRRIKSILNERVELSETGEEDLLSVSEYYGVAKRADIVDGENISRSDSLDGYKLCYINDIVSNIMLAWKGSLGRSAFNGIVSPAYGVYKPIDDIDSRYYHYLFRTEVYKGIFRANSRGIIESRLRLYTSNFLAINTVYPPIEEQRQIADYLNAKCGKIDAIIEKISAKIERLKQLKRALINEVVTGQRPINK